MNGLVGFLKTTVMGGLFVLLPVLLLYLPLACFFCRGAGARLPQRTSAQASKARQSENPNHALAGFWLEVLSYADKGDEPEMRNMFPIVVEKDWDIAIKPNCLVSQPSA